MKGPVISKVYFQAFNRKPAAEEIRQLSKKLLTTFLEKEKIPLAEEIPLKVHFGEKGNVTFLPADHYNGIIDFLEERKIKTCFIETNVMYGGQRCNQTLHLQTAREHGFTRIPVLIADGEHGENFYHVEINKKHLNQCLIGKEFARHDQIIVCSHFKGHLLAGFGGAIKQLAMGFASKGGKLAQHMGIKPRIKNSKCKKCGLCLQTCAYGAITLAPLSFIDLTKCAGCGACVSVCPHKAVTIFSFKSILRILGIGNPFQEKLAEYAYAAQKGKKNLYMNFAINITGGCDCEPRKMKPVMEDIGILVSIDPVAIDQASLDLARQKGKTFRGKRVLEHAEAIGLGSKRYDLVRTNI